MGGACSPHTNGMQTMRSERNHSDRVLIEKSLVDRNDGGEGNENCERRLNQAGLIPTCSLIATDHRPAESLRR
jgi:hypothetical protein